MGSSFKSLIAVVGTDADRTFAFLYSRLTFPLAFETTFLSALFLNTTITRSFDVETDVTTAALTFAVNPNDTNKK
ncbi:hypothetical protein DE166_001058 [Clostridium beijerinckii]|uniref:hypothetical protein n=1 Tax=Clostridium beijerinckii TaxID=1520 RepID=UPI0017F1B605|nr:hypothetical protein [Clostridium beijerinckii]NYD11758.1 hypothetical protein [Clostridium beijerinckii]